MEDGDEDGGIGEDTGNGGIEAGDHCGNHHQNLHLLEKNEVLKQMFRRR